MKRTYRLKQETHATFPGTERPTLATLPEGSIISLIGPAPENPDLVDVLWDELTVRMFACDFTARTDAMAEEHPKAATATANTTTPLQQPEGDATSTGGAPVKIRRFTASGREL